MEEWKEYKLGDVAVVKGGKRLPKGVNLVKEPNTHPYIRVRDLGTKRFLELDCTYEYVDDETQKSIARYIVNTGDIIISIVGTIGLTAIIGESLNYANLTENCVKLINIKGIKRDYLYYYLISDCGKQEIEKGIVGAVQAKLPIKNIQAISIKAPSLETQKRIASILSSLDDKIELNRKINANLEAQAQALFKSWLNRCTEEVSIGDLSQNITDYSKCNCERVVLINSSDVTEGRFEHHVLSENKNLKGHFKKRFQKGDILYSQVRPRNRHWGYCMFDADNYLASTQLMVIRNKSDILPSILLYQYMIDDKVWKEFTLKTETRSGTFPQGNYEDLSSIRVPFGTDVKEISDKLETIYSMIYTNEQESRRLASLRDALLPRLMSGELKVNEIVL